MMRLFGFVLRLHRKRRTTLQPPAQWAKAAVLDGHFDAVRAEFERESG
jgi:hypothetical protein